MRVLWLKAIPKTDRVTLQHGALCLSVQNPSFSFPTIPVPYSEDCLFIDVYAPASATPGSPGHGLPVMIWFQGGAFVQLFNPNYNGTGLIDASDGNVIVVSFNYRTGPYGFLANEELQAEGNLNIGLHDQRAAIKWVQRHISAFGGDPDKITLFGASVGGGSVLLQLLAYGGDEPCEDEVQWRSGIAQSVYLPPVYSVKDMEFHYIELLNKTQCDDLECLRALSTDEIQSANTATPPPGQANIPIFGYGPVIDGQLLPDSPTSLLKKGKFAKDKPLIMGTSRTEGTIFAPQAQNVTATNQFVTTQLPNLTNASLAQLQMLYNNTPSTLPGVQANISSFFYYAAELYGDALFTCPTINSAATLQSQNVPVHVFIDDIRDPVEVAAGYIVPHTWEVQAVWGPEYATQYVALPGADSYDVGKSNAAIVPVVQSYWTHFVTSGGDPNKLGSDMPVIWEDFERGQSLVLATNQTRMQGIDGGLLRKCAFWDSIAAQIGH
jgi:acetylcholinesterase